MDNKIFWTTIKPFFSHKVSKSSKITLVGGNEIISADKDIVQKSDKYYKNAVSSLNIQCDSITSIKENIVSPGIFKFCKINLDDILKELNNLGWTKNETFGDIPCKCLKLSSNEIAYISYMSGTN